VRYFNDPKGIVAGVGALAAQPFAHRGSASTRNAWKRKEEGHD
jgi:hypothetical protein